MKKIILVSIISICVVGLGFLILKPTPPLHSIESISSNTPLEQSSSISAVTLSFDFGGEKKAFDIATSGQENLFELIEKTDLNIETKNFPPIGKMIVSINGFKNGTDGKYWQYWINGQYAQIGASSYKPKPNDSIEWKFSNDSAQ